jgi:ABC-type molybdate transport system substrate-binding protein
MRQVAAGFTAARDIEVHIFVSPPDGIVGLVRHRARADVVVADAPTLQVLAAGGQVRSGSVVALGRDPYVLIAHAAIAAPPADAVQPFLAAHATAVSDPTTAAGFDGHAVLHEVAPDLDAARITGLPDTPDIIDAVRADPDLVGLVLQTEAVAQKLGLHQVARLGVPPEPIAGGLVTLGQSANAADLLAYVAGPEGQATLHQAGLE